MSVNPLPCRDEIANIIPHAGNMVLVEKVLFCDAKKLVANVMLSAKSPLAFDGKLGGETLLEYAGQCTALHGALSADSNKNGRLKARPAFISQTKALRWLPTLPDTTAQIEVNLEGQTADGAIYRFCVTDSSAAARQEPPNEITNELASGILSVIFTNTVQSGL